MINRFSGGDYVPDGAGGFVRLTGAQAALQTALFRLQCRNGAFPLLPDLGSQLYLLGREKASDRQTLARQYCVQALADLPVTVTGATVTQDADGVLRVAVTLDYQNQELTLEVAVT